MAKQHFHVTAILRSQAVKRAFPVRARLRHDFRKTAAIKSRPNRTWAASKLRQTRARASLSSDTGADVACSRHCCAAARCLLTSAGRAFASPLDDCAQAKPGARALGCASAAGAAGVCSAYYVCT